MNITVIGAGYVGLVTAAVFAELGNNVCCVEVVEEKVKLLQKGIVPFFEPGLAELIIKNQKQKRLSFTTSYKDCVPSSEIAFICVGTPPKSTGEADLSFLYAAVEETAKNIDKYTLITIKSTIPIGFEDELESIAEKYAKGKFDFASCPEFLREGTAVEDYLHPTRIVIGADKAQAQKLLLEIHAPLPGERIICDIRSAQLMKYGANALLATKISFANALSVLCERMGADVEKVVKGIGLDSRIGLSFLRPGVGYGGSCLPKDVAAFIALSSHFDYDFELLRAVDAINKFQIERFVNKVISAVGNKNADNLEGTSVGILGLSFKPNTDDMREAPSVKIISRLQDLGARISVYDPKAQESAKKIIQNVDFAKSEYEALGGKDALLLITEWPQFNELDFEKIKKTMKNPVIVDGRNFFNKEKMTSLGFKYYGVGR